MAWNRRRAAYAGFRKRASYFRPRRYSRGRFGASINPVYIGAAALGYTGMADSMIPPLARNALMLYGVLPISIKGLGPLKAAGKGYTAGVLLRSTFGNVLGTAGAGDSGGAFV